MDARQEKQPYLTQKMTNYYIFYTKFPMKKKINVEKY